MAATHFGIGKRDLDAGRDVLKAALEIRGYEIDDELCTAVRSAEHVMPIGQVTNTFIATVTAEGQLQVEYFSHVDVEAGAYRPTGRPGRTISRLGASRSAGKEADAIVQTANRYRAMQAELDAIVGG